MSQCRDEQVQSCTFVYSSVELLVKLSIICNVNEV